ncbi:hypothetical protein H5410_036964, partial [Solanum commersonii]
GKCIVCSSVLWCLWKRRNTILHRGSFSERKVIWEINDTILKVIKTRFYGHGTNSGRKMGYPLECVFGDYFHKLFEEFCNHKSTTFSDYQFNNDHDIPMEGRRILNLDKSGTPQIRRRKTN